MKAFAIISNGLRQWEEDFEVSSKETAEQEIKEDVDYFNRTLKPGEVKRQLVEIIRYETKEGDSFIISY